MKLIQIRIAGMGGQGIQTAGRLLAHAAILQRKFSAVTSVMGPEVRDGVSLADVLLSDRMIDFPGLSEIDILVPLTQRAYDAHPDGKLQATSVIVADPEVIKPRKGSGARHIWVGCLARLKREKLDPQHLAICMTAALVRGAKIVSMDAFHKAVKGHFFEKEALAGNLKAFDAGVVLGKKIRYAP